MPHILPSPYGFTMNALAKKIESFANVSIIIVAILLSVVLVKNYILAKPDDLAQTINNSQVHAGAKLPLQNIDWAKNGQTLVLAISSTYHFSKSYLSFNAQITFVSAKQLKELVAL